MRKRNAKRSSSQKGQWLEKLEDRYLMTTLSIADITVPEDIGRFDATVQLSEAHDEPINIAISTGSDTADGNLDYVIKFEQLTVQPGELSITTHFEVIDDSVVELQERFKLFITSTVDVTDGEASVTIIDNDTPTISVSDVSVSETRDNAAVELLLSGPAVSPVTVGVFTVGGSAKIGADFRNVFETVTIAARQTRGIINIPIVNDRISEVDETFVVNLVNPLGAELADASATVTIQDDDGVEFRTLNGSGNNLRDTDRGAAKTDVIRFGYPAGYVDGVGDDIDPRVAPNAREVSNKLMSQDQPIFNDRGLSDWIVQWGQFVTHDMALVNTGADNNVLSNGSVGNFSIPVLDPNDPLGPQSIPFNRSDFNPETGDDDPRQQVNEVTSYIDASVIYGSSDERATALRTFRDGKLKSSIDGRLLPLNFDGVVNDNMSRLPDNQLFVAGDPRVNEATGLVATQTLFMREHNRLADLIKQHDSRLNDEQIYQWARRIVSAEIQKITYEEFLPALMGEAAAPKAEDYDYNEGVNASITNSFTAAFFRFGHSMQSSNLLVVDDDDNVVDELALRDQFFTPQRFRENSELVGQALKGLASQVAQENDVFLVDDVRNFLFGPPGAGGTDLGALDVQRGRDHGLIPLNEIRPVYAASILTRPADPNAHPFSVLSSDPHVQETLQELYGSIDNVEAFVGGIAEDHEPGSSVGEMLQKSFQDQFSRLRDGDRFFYTGDEALRDSVVTSVVDLPSRTLADIIRDNTPIDSLQDNVFFANRLEFDFGDAPAPYPTTLERNGARHVARGPSLGDQRSAEKDANVSSDGRGDEGDSGIELASNLVAGTQSVFVSTVENLRDAKIDGWIDFNGDGDWDDAGEHVADSVPVTSRVQQHSFAIPPGAVLQETFARFRVSTEDDLAATGFASDGEVEDYRLTIRPQVGNSAPVAVDDVGLTATPGQVLSITGSSLTGNDFDPEGDTISIAGVEPVSTLGAIVTLNGDGGVSYDPTASEQLKQLPIGEAIVDRFVYEIVDDEGLTSRATVEVQLQGTNSFVGFPAFQAAAASLGEASHDEVELADFDGDGDLDAFLTRQRFPDEVWFNDGAGTFTNSGQTLTRGSADRDRSIYADVADLDNDGDIDVAVASQTGVLIWHNDGAGNFTMRPEPRTTTVVDIANVDAHDLALGDLNADGHVDVFLARNGASDQIWLNDGQGDYDLVDQPSNNESRSIDLADVDGDGDLDAVVGAIGPNKVFRNLGDGTFQDTGQRLGDRLTEHIELGDLDGDGDVDAVAGNAADRGEANRIWFNDGSGNFTDSGQSLGSSATSHIALADFDNDGDLDAMTANWFEQADKIWRNLGNGFFIDSGLSLEGQRSSHIGIGDLDGDGDTDALIASFAEEPNRIWLNSPIEAHADDVTLNRITPPEFATLNVLSNDSAGSDQLSVVSVNGSSERIALGEFGSMRWELDGRMTYLLDPNSSRVNTLPIGSSLVDTFEYSISAPGHGTATSQVRITIPGNFEPTEVLALSVDGFGGNHLSVESLLADFDGDNDLDWFVTSNESPNQVWFNDGSGFFVDSGQRLGDTDRTVYGDAGDVDGDGDIDVVTASIDANTLWMNEGDGTFVASEQSLGDEEIFTQEIELGDLDNDGDLDMFVANRSSGGPRSQVGHGNWVFLNDGNGNFTQNDEVYGSEFTTGLELIDVDDDGFLDAITSSGRDHGNRIWLNDGDGTFREGPRLDPGGQHITGGDIDGDGDTDLVQATLGPNRVWVQQADGSFIHRGQELSDLITSHVQLADFDQDGDQDMIVANWKTPDEIYLNDGRGRFVDSGMRLNGDSKTEHIALGDLDGDGDIDAAVTVFGGPNRVYLNVLNVSSQQLDAPEIVSNSPAAEIGGTFTIGFDVDVTATLEAADLSLVNRETDQRHGVSLLGFDASSNVATISTVGVPGGRYTLEVDGNGVTDADGVRLDGDGNGTPGGRFTTDFIVTTPGDANLDGSTSFLDFLILAQNFGKTDVTWAEGDFTGDGDVNFFDLLVLANNLGVSI